MPRIAAALGVLATVAFCIGFNIQRYPVVWQSAAAAPDSPTGPNQPATVAKPLEAIAGAIRAAGSAVQMKGISQPIPLPQVAGLSKPIPAPKPARSESSAEPVPDPVVAGPAEKYARAPEAPREPVAAKAKPATKPKPADSKKKTAQAAKPKAPAQRPTTAKPKAPAQRPTTALVSRPIEIPKAESPKVAPPKPARPEQPAARVTRRLVPVRRDASELAAAGVPGWNTSKSPWSAPAEPDRAVRRLPPVEGEPAQPQNPYAAGSNRIPFYSTTGM